MSVAAIPSPASRCKRLYEAADVDLGYEGGTLDNRQQKRTRLQRSSPPATGRFGYHPSEQPALANALAAILALFPGMNEKVVQDVLVECGNSIDAAIKRLTDLRLSTEDATVAAATAAASAADGGQQSASPTGIAAQATSQPAEAPSSSCPSPGEPQTADQWIEYLVAEMLVSKDIGDARTRAAQVLQHFERFVKQRQKDEADARVTELLKENSIFKRAVQIQDARMKAGADELAQLRTMVAHYQERCSKLEMNNYSLAMHLQQATNGSGLGSHPHNPDVC